MKCYGVVKLERAIPRAAATLKMRNAFAIACFLSILTFHAYGGTYSSPLLFTVEMPNGFSDCLISTAQQSPGLQVVGWGVENAANEMHAIFWSKASGSAVDLNPNGFRATSAYGTCGTRQVGDGIGTATGNAIHALIWTGTADSVVDLHPTKLSGFTDSVADSTSDTLQVGYGRMGPYSHALLWSGTADSAVDLNPTNLGGFTSSLAIGVSGSQQVGYGNGSATGNDVHALLWSGTADSAVDLNPTNLSGITSSTALGIGGSEQVGCGDDLNNPHALLWTGSANSAVDLHPSAFTWSQAVATNGIQQVGVGFVERPYALVWSGTAESVINLDSLLPADGNWSYSQAYSIDMAGNIFGIAYGGYDNFTGYFAVEWSPVPEPAAAFIFIAFASCGLLHRRREG